MTAMTCDMCRATTRIRSYCCPMLCSARFKVPKRCYVVAELPRNAMGKVQKNLLRARYASANSDTV